MTQNTYLTQRAGRLFSLPENGTHQQALLRGENSSQLKFICFGNKGAA
jgi:hypothetical protein